MGKISTSELFQKYYAASSPSAANFMKSIEKPDLYAYELEVGKELIDMNVDELFGLINALMNKRRGREISFIVSAQSYDRVASLLRTLFDFYIEHVEVIRNPLDDKKMRGKEALRRFAEKKEVISYELVQDIILRMHRDYEPDRADYAEMIILLYYCGFDDAEQIVTLQEKMIDHRNKTVMLPGRIVHLSDRCYSLLVKFHNQDVIEGWRNYHLCAYKGGYFKFVVRKASMDLIDERSIDAMCNLYNHYLAVYVNQKYDVVLNYRTLYWLGFYDFMCRKVGAEETDDLIKSYRDTSASSTILSLAREYGVKYDNVTTIKKFLYPYVKI